MKSLVARLITADAGSTHVAGKSAQTLRARTQEPNKTPTSCRCDKNKISKTKTRH